MSDTVLDRERLRGATAENDEADQDPLGRGAAVYLFLSVDMDNSTAFKGMDARWPFVIHNFYEDVVREIRNVCPHFYMTGARGAIPIQAPHLLKALIRQEQNISRCQLRGGVHLEQGYVNDVCLTPRFNQCVFYEDELTKS